MFSTASQHCQSLLDDAGTEAAERKAGFREEPLAKRSLCRRRNGKTNVISEATPLNLQDDFGLSGNQFLFRSDRRR